MFVVNNVGNLYNWLLAVKRLAVWIKSEKNRKKYLITSKNWLKVWALSGLVKKTTKSKNCDVDFNEIINLDTKRVKN